MSRKKNKKKLPAACRLRLHGAFTLLEVMLSVAVISIVALGAIYGFITFGQVRAQSHHMSVASLWAQDKLEEYKASSYGSIPDGNDTEDVYARTWSSSGYAGPSSIITVTVTYPSNSSTMNSVTLTTIKANK